MNILTEISVSILGGLAIVGFTVISISKMRYTYYLKTQRNPHNGKLKDTKQQIT